MNDSLYRLVGSAAINGGKWYLRNRYGRLMVPKTVVAGGVVVVGVAVAAVALSIKGR